MSTIFTKIVNGEIPSYKIAETEDYYAFLDINPIVEGHTLVIPKKEIDYIFDLDEDTLAGLNIFAKKVAKAIEQAIKCKRVGIMVIGTEVPHAHIHLIPFSNEAQMSVMAPKLKLDSDRMKDIAGRITPFI